MTGLDSGVTIRGALDGLAYGGAVSYTHGPGVSGRRGGMSS